MSKTISFESEYSYDITTMSFLFDLVQDDFDPIHSPEALSRLLTHFLVGLENQKIHIEKSDMFQVSDDETEKWDLIFRQFEMIKSIVAEIKAAQHGRAVDAPQAGA